MSAKAVADMLCIWLHVLAGFVAGLIFESHFQRSDDDDDGGDRGMVVRLVVSLVSLGVAVVALVVALRATDADHAGQSRRTASENRYEVFDTGEGKVYEWSVKDGDGYRVVGIGDEMSF